MKKMLTASVMAVVLAGGPAWASAPMSRDQIAHLAPVGTNPSTPRSNWDQCDGTNANYIDGISFVGDTTSWTWLPQRYLDFPFTPASAYVACTLSGPVTAANDYQQLTFTTKVTNVTDQVVDVALTTVEGSGFYKAWSHAPWRILAPGQSTEYVQHLVHTLTEYGPYPLLVRPSIGPKDKPNYTVWVNIDSNYFTHVATAAPSGACNEPVTARLAIGGAGGIASAPNGGYWVSSSYGQISACGASNYNDYSDGTAPFIVSDPAGNGYWLANNWGWIAAFGAARWYGQYNRETDVTGMAATVSGKGYWLVTGDGTVLHYGNAPYFGEAHIKNGFVQTLQDPSGVYSLASTGIAGIAPTEGMHGYVLVAKDGTVYGFGKARGGACGSVVLPHGAYVAGVAPDYRTGGYWVAASDGHVFACHAPSYPYKRVTGTVVGIGALGNGLGYRLVTTGGQVFDYGAAVWRGNPN
jgi:hypothetical protein